MEKSTGTTHHAVISVVRGKDITIEDHQCYFCSNPATCTIGKTIKKTFDGTLYSYVHLCEDHAEKFEALLDGRFKIDRILEERKIVKHRGIRLR